MVKSFVKTPRRNEDKRATPRACERSDLNRFVPKAKVRERILSPRLSSPCKFYDSRGISLGRLVYFTARRSLAPFPSPSSRFPAHPSYQSYDLASISQRVRFLRNFAR